MALYMYMFCNMTTCISCSHNSKEVHESIHSIFPSSGLRHACNWWNYWFLIHVLATGKRSYAVHHRLIHYNARNVHVHRILPLQAIMLICTHTMPSHYNSVTPLSTSTTHCVRHCGMCSCDSPTHMLQCSFSRHEQFQHGHCLRALQEIKRDCSKMSTLCWALRKLHLLCYGILKEKCVCKIM